MKRVVAPLAAAVLLLAATLVEAQQFIYPAKGQSPDEQKKDEYECHTWAVQQTGFDPTQSTQPAATTTPAKSVGGSAVKGAAAGAVIAGVTDNDAGKGALTGAAVGGVGRKVANNRNAKQSEQKAADQVSSQKVNYARARAACLEGRGYTIK